MTKEREQEIRALAEWDTRHYASGKLHSAYRDLLAALDAERALIAKLRTYFTNYADSLTEYWDAKENRDRPESASIRAIAKHIRGKVA